MNYNKVAGQDYEEFMEEARKDPEVAEYLDRRISIEEALGYVIAAMNAEGYFDAKNTAALLIQIETQFMNMKPAEAVQHYIRSVWRSGVDDADM